MELKQRKKNVTSRNKRKWKIMAQHRTKEIVYGNMMFNSEEECHAHWAKIKRLNMVDDWLWYMPMPCKG